MASKRLFPIEGFAGAAVCATVLLLLLLAIRHPVEELAVTSALLYVAVWLCSEGISRLFLKLLDFLIGYGERVSQKLGVGVDEKPEQSQASTVFGTLVAIVVVVLLLGAVLGSALSVGSFAVEAVGLTALPGPVLWFAWGAAIGGAAGLALILSFSALAFRLADSLFEVNRATFSQFQDATKEVDFKLRRSKLVPAVS